MSSLRLALKQSLQETGHLVPKEKKKRTSKKQDKKKPREDGRPRKRGRPPKRRPRPEEEEEEEVSTPTAVEAAEAVTAKVDKRPFVDDEGEAEEEEEFSSENEFSYDSEEEEEDSEEDEEEEEEDEHEEEEEVVAQRQDKKVDVDHKRDHHQHRHHHGEEKETSHKSHTTIQDTNESSSSKHQKESSHRDDGDSEEERRRQRKLLKKKLKNSAANKIQSQWKKRKNRNSPNPESKSKMEPPEDKTSTQNTATATSSSSHHKNEKETDPASEKGKSNKPESNAEPETSLNPVALLEKKKRKPGTVPAPSHDILEWSQRLTEKKARKHISKGMRVKVRFATKVRRDGKIVKKRKWYGGRVSNVTPDGSKIKIKYDDGTSEISQFPDDDVVVDATHNGQHSQTASAVVHRFLPPQARTPTPTPPVVVAAVEEEKREKKPEAAIVEKKPEEVEKGVPKEKEPPKVVEPSKDEKEKEPGTKPAQKEKKPEEGEIPQEKKEENKEENPKPKKDKDKEDVEMGEVQERKSPTPPVPEEPKPTTVETAKSEDGEVEEKPKASPEKVDAPAKKKLEKETEPKPMDTDEPAPPSDDKPKEGSKEKAAALETLKEEGEEEEEEEKKSSPPPKKPEAPTATTKASKPTLTIRISKAKVQEKLQEKPPETPKHATAYSSDEGELDADTPVTERKVKSLKVKRKRISEDSPSASRPKKRKAEVAAAGDVQDKKSEDATTTEHEKKSKKSKIITIPLKKAEQPTEVPELPSLVGASGKSKKKDKERSNSPVPRRKTPTPTPREDSPLPMSQDLAQDRDDGETTTTMVKPVSKKATKAAATDIVENDDDKDTEKAPKAAIGSKGSAFGKKAKAVAHSEPEGKEAKPKEHHFEKTKPGRKAAQEAKEKMGPNKKEHHQNQDEKDLLKKKKKRKRKDGVANSDEDESDDEERQWVQCDKCQKWRILPSKMEASSLPEVWQCSMNSWDPKHADCAVAEQTLKQIQKERRRAKKRAKQQRLEQAALEAAGGQVESSKHDKPPRGTKSAQNSPKPNKPVVKVGKNSDLELKRASPVPSSANASIESDSKAEKRGRKGKRDKEEAKQVETQKVVASGEVTTPKKPGRKRGRPARNNPVEAARNESKDDDNVEWVQCEKCEKWRKLPPYMSADELPDSWYCSLNTWNETSASCDAPEDKADAHHQEVGVFGNMPQGHVGKYSYRSMIYGSGRKYNRPMSEKARAAESLYQRPQLEEGMPQTSVMYAKSSMFVPRMSNFQKTQVVEEKRTSIFDVLADSDLWAELQGVGHAMQVLSNSNLSGNQQASFLTYDSLPESIKEQMREVVLQVLGVYVLSGEELVEEALRFPWESLSGDLAQIRAFINDDIVINTLLSLVKEGEVQMTCFKDMSVPMTEWIPRYRRVVRSSPKNLEAHESLKTSKCMKISKPWKQMDDSDGWITGGQ